MIQNTSIRLIFLGGLGEIGMNCMLIETAQSIIMIDCGVLFTQLEHFGVEFVIPDFSYLLERKEKFCGFFLTHGHEDHIGALPFALKKGLHAPIFASAFTMLLVQQRLKENNLDADLQVVSPYQTIEVPGFAVTFIPVNHSIVQSNALLIHTSVGNIIHTGDFKIDTQPFVEAPMDLKFFEAQKNVRLLLSDSTNVEKISDNISEKQVSETLLELFQKARGLSIISLFASNIVRISQVFEIAKKLNKKILLAGRTMLQNVQLAQQAGYLEDALVMPLESISTLNRKDVILLSTGSQAESRSALTRIAYNEHPLVQLTSEDQVILSSKVIPGNEKAIGSLVNQFFRQGVEVIYESVETVHASGHANQKELLWMLSATQPQAFIPIHGEYRHLVLHAKLAQTLKHSTQICIANTGDILEMTAQDIKVVDRLKETKIFIGNVLEEQISREVLKERKKLAKYGVICCATVQKHENLLLPPELISMGLLSDSENVFAELRKIVMKTLQTDPAHPPEAIRLAIRRYLVERLGYKTNVIPLILRL